MSIWKKDHGFAVTKQTFIASDKNELTIIAGDAIEVFDSTKDWFLGKTIHNQKCGIFPRTFVWFKSVKEGSGKEYLESPEDLLVYEANITLREALQKYKELPGYYAVSTFNIIEEIEQIFSELENSGKSASFLHFSLGRKIKTLRDILGFPPAFRCADYTPVSISNWNLDNFIAKYAPIPADTTRKTRPEHYYIQIHGIAQNLTSQKNLRISLKTNSNPLYPLWVSQPVSYTVSPSSPDFYVEFDDLDEAVLKSNLSLIVFYDSIKTEKNMPDTRTPCGLCVMKLQLKAPYDKDLTITEKSYAIPQEYHANIHELFAENSSEQQLGCLSFSATCSVYSDNVGVADKSISKFVNVPSYRFALSSLVFEQRTKLHVTVKSIEHDANRLLKYKVRLLNAAKKTFEPVFACSVAAKKQLKYDQQESSSIVIKATKEAQFDETFTMDISNIEADLKDLYIIVEVQRSGMMGSSLSAFGFSYLKLADKDGNLAENLSTKEKLYTLSYKGDNPTPSNFNIEKPGKVVGSVNYIVDVSSSTLTNNKVINTICCAKKAGAEETNALNEFAKLDISTWKQYADKIVIAICNLICLAGKDSKPFVNALFDISEKIASLDEGSAYAMIQPIYAYFNKFNNCKQVKGIYQKILSEISERLAQGKEAEPQFIKTIKYIPFLLGICKTICSIDGSSSNLVSAVSNLFQRFNAIIGIKREEGKPEIKNVQNELIKHYPSMFDSLTPSIQASNVPDYIAEFMKSIDSEGEANEGKETKLNFLINVTKTKFWLDKPTRKKLSPIISETVNACQSVPQLEQTLLLLLASIFFTSHDNMLLNYTEFYEKCTEMKGLDANYFLLCLLYQFPRTISIKVAFKILQNQMIEPPIRFFMLMFFLMENESRIEKILKDNNTSIDEKMDIFRNCLSTASYAATPCGIEIDRHIMTKLYNVHGNFKILPKLYSKLTKEEQANHSLLSEIIDSYTYYESSDLKELFFIILSAEYDINHNMSNIMSLLFTILKGTTNLPRFNIIGNLFQTSKKEFQGICKDLKKIVSSLQGITKDIQISRKNEFLLLSSSKTILDIAREVGSKSISREMLINIININEKLGNKVELAFALLEALKEIPCTNKEKFTILKDSSKTGRVIHIEFLRRAIKLLSEEGQEEFALIALNKLKKECAEAYKHYELLPEIYKIEAQLYRNIARNPRFFSKYYRVSFSGNDAKIPEAGKTFIYRRTAAVTSTQFPDELKSLFPTANIIKRESKQENKDTFSIIYDMVNPSCEEGEKDPMYHTDTNRPNYIIKFEENNFPTIFKSELTKDKNGKSYQDFMHIADAIPTYISRVEVTQTNRKEVTQLEASCLYLIKETTKLNADVFDKNSEESVCILHIKSTLVGINRDTPEILKKYMNAKYFNSQSQNIQNTIKEYARILEDYISTIKKCIDYVTPLIDSPQTQMILESVKSDYQGVEKMITTAVKETFPSGV